MGARMLMVVVAAFALVAPVTASAAVPSTFHGVTIQEPPTGSDIARMRSAGIQTVRFQVSWQTTEPTPGVFDWSMVDRYVLLIEAAGATPLPFFDGAPDWLPNRNGRSPLASAAARAAWSDFVAAMARRYGPGGTVGLPAPIRTWQLWNEPNLELPWKGPPDPRAYGRMAEAGAASIRAVDPGARIMLAGLAPAARGIKPWTFMRRLLKTLDPAAFDAAAIHPYGSTLPDVAGQVSRLRRQMIDVGARLKPLAVTEIGWSSSRQAVPTLAGTQRTQARKLAAAYRVFARHRAWRISEVLWYSLRDRRIEPANCGFCTTSGLLRIGGTPKPAWIAFKRSLRELR